MPFLPGVAEKLKAMKPDDYKWSRNKDLGLVFKITKRSCGDAVKMFNKFRLAEMVNGVLNSLIGDDEEDDGLWFAECYPNDKNPFNNPYYSIFDPELN